VVGALAIDGYVYFVLFEIPTVQLCSKMRYLEWLTAVSHVTHILLDFLIVTQVLYNLILP